MVNRYFENQSFFDFIKAEYKQREKVANILLEIISLFFMFFLGIINYVKNKDWYVQYMAIEKNVLRFYHELDCTCYQEKPSSLSIIKSRFNNKPDENVSCFKNAHIAITSDTLFVFPYSKASKENFYVKTLGESYRLVFGKKIRDKKYHKNQGLEFISLEQKQDNTILRFLIKGLNVESKIIFKERIVIQ